MIERACIHPGCEAPIQLCVLLSNDGLMSEEIAYACSPPHLKDFMEKTKDLGARRRIAHVTELQN